MVTRWDTCNVEKKKLWFNFQLTQKPNGCLEFIILHELIHFHTPKHDAAFIAHMDLYMPNWRDIRNELNDRKLDYYDAHDESPLKKLIAAERYDEIKNAVLRYLENDPDLDKKKYTHALMEIIGAKDDVGKAIRCAIQPNGFRLAGMLEALGAAPLGSSPNE